MNSQKIKKTMNPQIESMQAHIELLQSYQTALEAGDPAAIEAAKRAIEIHEVAQQIEREKLGLAAYNQQFELYQSQQAQRYDTALIIAANLSKLHKLEIDDIVNTREGGTAWAEIKRMMDEHTATSEITNSQKADMVEAVRKFLLLLRSYADATGNRPVLVYADNGIKQLSV